MSANGYGRRTLGNVSKDGGKEPGTYTIRWDASLVPSGVYFYSLRAGHFMQTRKMLLVR
jgi:hypothetical protein